MSGGLVQIAAYGSQDVYLTGEPQITFWKGVYHRHTHFATECIENSFSGVPDFGKTASCVISRNADLFYGAHLEVYLPYVENTNETAMEYCDNVGLDEGR